jgi:hypothetical protein
MVLSSFFLFVTDELTGDEYFKMNVIYMICGGGTFGASFGGVA